jgi:outer membrane scaffolding protein for murein synthesis (MipA/OmpV family)
MRWNSAAAVLAVAGGGQVACAQEAPGAPPAEAAWTVEVGAAAIAVPRYPGSDHLRLLPVPDARIAYRDIAFAAFETGVGANLVRLPTFRAGVLARPDFGRTARDVSRYRPGLSAVAFAPEVGVFGEYDLSRSVSARAEVRHAIGGHDGLVADLSASYGRPLGRGGFLSVGPDLKFGDDRFTGAYFGVTPDAAARSGLPAYRPSGGLTSAGLRTTAAYPLAPRLTAALTVAYERLLGDAARSPVVQGPNGSRNQPTLVLSLRYAVAGGR